MNLRNKKTVIISALRVLSLHPPEENAPWDNWPDKNMARLTRAPMYHLEHFEQGLLPLDADIYVMCQFDISLIEREIEMCKYLKSLGKKIVIGFSADLRFLIGNCLISPLGTLYTELLEYVDIIMSGIHTNWAIYGRYSHKVMPYGVVVEKLNFSNSNVEKNIDILFGSSCGDECLGFNLELLLMIKERHPGHRICYSITPSIIPQVQKYADRIEFVYGTLIERLPYTKLYMDAQLRPRSGRSLLEAFYFRVPTISTKWAYHSRFCPDYTFDIMDFGYIADLYDKFLLSDRNAIVIKMEEQAEFDYFDNFWPRLLDRLYA
jgi:hypothetical protein